MNRKEKSRLASALRHVRRGWAVFPLHGVQSGECTCGNPDCKRVGKHPLTAHGLNDATTDEATIRRWWKKHPKANIGIATGSRSDLVVVDIDPRHSGSKSLRKFEDEDGPLPDGPQVRTGGGGVHLHFRHPGGRVKTRTGVLQGIDIRADGGYVVGAGSRHESGEFYLWVEGKTPKKMPLPLLPDRLLKLINERPSPPPQPEPVIPEGKRNSTLASLAGGMRYRGFTGEAIEAALLEENRQRCDPPLSDAEVGGIARSIASYPPGDQEILSASSRGDVQAERKTLTFHTGKEIAIETPRKVPWIAPPLVACGAITEIDGKIKAAGKTTFATHLVNAVLEGSPFLGEPTTGTKAVYLTEQPKVSFRQAMQRSGLLGRKDFTVLFWAETIGTPWSSIVEAAIAECRRKKAKLLVVDTLGQFAGLVGDSENNAGDALRALRPLQQAAAEGIGVIIVRHERKKGGAPGESARGSSAFGGAVDIIITLQRPEGNQARNIRVLEMVSRFDNQDKQLIELTDHGYRVLGAPGAAAKAQAGADLLEQIPEGKKEAVTIDKLVGYAGKSRAHVQKLLDTLAETGEISKIGKGRKGSPFRYFKP